MIAHTPAPWLAHETETRTAINAALIAAAPELLEALLAMVDVFGPGVDYFGEHAAAGELEAVSKARAAIEKATAK